MLHVIYSVTAVIIFVFKQKTAYDMRISDWSSDVCSSDLGAQERRGIADVLDGDVAAQRRGGFERRQHLAEVAHARGGQGLDRPGRDRVDAGDRKSVVSGRRV